MERELPLDSAPRGGVMYLLAAERERGGRARADGPGPHLENRILRTENRIEIEFRRFRWIG